MKILPDKRVNHTPKEDIASMTPSFHNGTCVTVSFNSPNAAQTNPPPVKAAKMP
ncbi:hypothetical protein ACHSBP_07480 [Pseudoalteromonas sp. XMcav1-K]|uniref:hypothetical protein n=1 Tax=Pseudoalteromonas sp. XMcav1-K TaxID=3374372 RepID=UPI00375835DB